jgi:hypothetical protein
MLASTSRSTCPRSIMMDALNLILAVVVALVGFDLLAGRFGVDSRDRIGDDRRRPVAS